MDMKDDASIGTARQTLLNKTDWQADPPPQGATRGKKSTSVMLEELGSEMIKAGKGKDAPYGMPLPPKITLIEGDHEHNAAAVKGLLRLLQRTTGAKATTDKQAASTERFMALISRTMKNAKFADNGPIDEVMGFDYLDGENSAANIGALIDKIEEKLGGAITDVQDWNSACTAAGRTSLLRRLKPVAPLAIATKAPQEGAHGAQGQGAPKPSTSKYSLVDWSKLAISAGNVNTSNALGIIQYYQSRASMAATITCGKHVSPEVAAEALADYHNAMAAADYWFEMVYDGVGAHTDSYKKYRKRGRSESGEADERDEEGGSKGSGKADERDEEGGGKGSDDGDESDDNAVFS